MKNLLVETQNFKPIQNISESRHSKRGNPVVGGVMATAEVKNGNGRYYSKALWNREVNKYQTLIDENRALGELDHPDSQVVNLKNSSHNVTKLYWDGDNLMGFIEILPTPSGNILKALIENGITVGVSSRGMGSLEQRGDLLEVQDDFELLCWDFVSTPSNPGSFMHTIKESKETSFNTYKEAHNIVREILCSKGQCPIL
tara:strand:- start:9 stop:608 length:600 start_codon:yes stop_codon:yes gene_type:complete